MIVVFGSITLDMVVSPPRLPKVGETALVDSYALYPGGKGANQAYAAARCGSKVRFIGNVGSDQFADLALANLQHIGAGLEAVGRVDMPTACASVWVDSAGENQIVVASGANLTTTAQQLAENPPDAGDVCVFQLELSPEETWQAVRLAGQAGTRSVMNAAPFRPIPVDVLDTLDVLILNEVEAEMIAEDHGIAGTPEIVTGILGEQHDLTVVVTLGPAGAIVYCPDRKERFHASALDIVPLDTVGAGDAFVGAFAAALHEGFSPDECLRRGTVAGSLTCLGSGAQESVPDGPEIEHHLGKIEITKA
jgi:ribokinase